MPPQLHTETARQRELYKYWQPNESIYPSADYDESFNRDYQPRPSYDSALTAYAQLGALRCNAKRGMISVVDQSYQYIIAEGTKTLSLQDGTVVDQDDQLWFGLRTIPRAVGICATALGQFTTVEAQDGSVSDTLFEPLQFIIPDLSKDARFTNQPFVCGVPHLRFYAGVPIRSPAGYIIGIYSIVDDKPREDFGESDLNVLKDLAATVMDHLVLGTVRGRHHRADRMVKGLGLFVEGKATLRDWWLRSGYLARGPTTKDGSRGEWTLKAQAEAEFGPQVEAIPDTTTSTQQSGLAVISPNLSIAEGNSVVTGPVNAALCLAPSEGPADDHTILDVQNSKKVIQETKLEALDFVSSSSPEGLSRDAVGRPPLQHSTSSDFTGQVEKNSLKESETETLRMSQEMGLMFDRASNLIRESITVEGCLFLDAGPTTIEHTLVPAGSEKRESSKSTRSASSDRKSTSEDEGSVVTNNLDGIGRGRRSSLSHPETSRSLCGVLGCSLQFDPHLSEEETKRKFRFPKAFLQRLFRRYPNGTILNFEHDGSISSEEDLNSNSTFKPRTKKTKSSLREFDAKIIMDTFPGIRRLAFFPLWDTSTKSWFCGALAWTNDPLRVLDPVDDMAYLAAFGNSIMAEKARLDASMADRMKGNFISTVSHELRSPLHGILASAELLKDMSISTAQIDVVNMINICGRTLLDTINHVLDFTELNRHKKPKISEKKKLSSGGVAKTQINSGYSLVNQISNLDLSLLIEEVVDSTLAGYNFGQSGSAALSSSDHQSFGLEARSHVKDDLIHANRHVKVIVDIDWRSSWVFAFQPGAWRRILMNLFGNALKYTQAGYVCVSLKSIANVSKQDSPPSVILTVSDSGRGISKQFLKHHIFTPFLQEDTLAAGTGLGLSIVQQIVHGLDGQIDIKSEKGLGTKVTVQIPLVISTRSSSLGHVQGNNADLETVRQKMKGLKLYIVSPRNLSDSEAYNVTGTSESDAVLTMKKSLGKTLTHWFGVEVVEGHLLDSNDGDICFLFEDELNTFRTQEDNDRLELEPQIIQLAKANALIVLSTTPASLDKTVSELRNHAHFIQQPFGPHKLTRAFDTLLKQKAVPTQPLVAQLDSMSINQIPIGKTVEISDYSDHTLSAAKVMDTEGDFDLALNSSFATHTTPLIENHQAPIDLQLPTVLLVDDNEINLKLLVMYMRKLKYPYQTAVNGLEALQAFKKSPLALRYILMDISMPVMDGLESTRQIRKHERELGLPPATILALTGASSVNARESALSSGIDKFLTKPVPLNVVREYLNGTMQLSQNIR